MEAQRYCFVCSKIASSKCSKCKQFYYCGTDHQRQHWHAGHSQRCLKVSIKDWNEFQERFASTVLNGTALDLAVQEYRGKREIGSDKLVWFFKPVKYTQFLDGSVLKHYTSSSRKVPMSNADEVALFHFTGKCSVIAYASALALLLELEKSEMRYQNLFVKKVCVGRVLITKQFRHNIFCYESIMPHESENDNIDKWDCDRLHSTMHQALVLELEDGRWYIMDFAAAQYGLYDKTPAGRGYLYKEVVETKPVTESFQLQLAYGGIFNECIPYSSASRLLESLDHMDRRTLVIKKMSRFYGQLKESA